MCCACCASGAPGSSSPTTSSTAFRCPLPSNQSACRLHFFQPPRADQMSEMIVRISTHHTQTFPENGPPPCRKCLHKVPATCMTLKTVQVSPGVWHHQRIGSNFLACIGLTLAKTPSRYVSPVIFLAFFRALFHSRLAIRRG